MPSLHLICRGGLNLRHLEAGVYESGNWKIGSEEADQLVGGWLYLHETKSQPSYFGGEVLDWKSVEDDVSRVVFRLRSRIEAKNVPWRGAAHGMAWSGGLVE